MSMVFKPHMEILPPEQKRLWSELRSAAKLGFVLYGGTAVALRLGHRASVDFDFFSEKQLDREAIQKAFEFMTHAVVLQDRLNTLSLLVPSEDSNDKHVKLSFSGGIGIGRVGIPGITDDNMLQIASLEDLMATKLKVMLQRVEAKDYRDIAAMLQAGVSLSKGLASARQMYGGNFQPSESLKALVYFEGGDLFSLTKDEKDIIVNTASKVRDLPKVQILDHRLTAG
jgi:Nucleotidyl transferase AbiEii toxin, Type IV TA system